MNDQHTNITITPTPRVAPAIIAAGGRGGPTPGDPPHAPHTTPNTSGGGGGGGGRHRARRGAVRPHRDFDAARRTTDARLRADHRTRDPQRRPLAAEPRRHVSGTREDGGSTARSPPPRPTASASTPSPNTAGRCSPRSAKRRATTPTNRGTSPGTSGRGDLRRLMSELGGQVRQVGRFGSDEQRDCGDRRPRRRQAQALRDPRPPGGIDRDRHKRRRQRRQLEQERSRTRAASSLHLAVEEVDRPLDGRSDEPLELGCCEEPRQQHRAAASNLNAPPRSPPHATSSRRAHGR